MSYLLMEKAPLSGSKCIISFWVKVGKTTPKEDKWKEEWQPKNIEKELKKDEVAYPGGSYWSSIPLQFDAPRVVVWPLHNEPLLGPVGPGTWRHNFVPFITFGKTDIPYKRTEWKVEELRADWWVFMTGGVAQKIMAHRPQVAGAKPPAAAAAAGGGGTGGTGGGGGTSPSTRASTGGGLDTSGEGGPAAIPLTPAATQGQEKDIVPPSMIGLYDGGLRIILQCETAAKYIGCAWAQSRARNVSILTAFIDAADGPQIGDKGRPVSWHDLWAEKGYGYQKGNAFYYDDVSDLECGQHPETFVMDPPVAISDGNWHHVALSFDLGSVDAPQGPPAPPGGGGGTPPPTTPPATREAGGGAEGGGGGGGAAPLPPSPNAGKPGDAAIVSETTGPEEGKTPCYPGAFGQFSGPKGEFVLGFQGGYPIEDCGKYPPWGARPLPPPPPTFENPSPQNPPIEAPDDVKGKIKSKCKAWLMVDGINIIKKGLHHKSVYTDKNSVGLGDNDIVPVNALAVMGAEIRTEMTTSCTRWERDYRGALNGWKGPAARIEETDETRRYDYPRCRYEFTPGALPWNEQPIGIPGGKVMPNNDIMLAELQIWDGKAQDLVSIRQLFIDPKDGTPVNPSIAAQTLGKPTVMLHYSSNWKRGYNTGESGSREVGEGQEKKKEPVPDKQFVPSTGKIERYLPDPVLNKPSA